MLAFTDASMTGAPGSDASPESNVITSPFAEKFESIIPARPASRQRAHGTLSALNTPPHWVLPAYHVSYPSPPLLYQ